MPKWINPYEYKGYKGTALDNTECEFYDDMPCESVEEMVLKVMAGGQVSDRLRRSAYYDVDNENIEPDDVEELEPEDFEIPDYEQLYKDLKLKKINEWRATKGLEPIKQELQESQEPEPEPEPKPKKRKRTIIEEDVE